MYSKNSGGEDDERGAYQLRRKRFFVMFTDERERGEVAGSREIEKETENSRGFRSEKERMNEKIDLNNGTTHSMLVYCLLWRLLPVFDARRAFDV